VNTDEEFAADTVGLYIAGQLLEFPVMDAAGWSSKFSGTPDGFSFSFPSGRGQFPELKR
jgi:hypothetical protein